MIATPANKTRVKISVNFAISLMPRILIHRLAGRECASRRPARTRVLTTFLLHPQNRVKAAACRHLLNGREPRSGCDAAHESPELNGDLQLQARVQGRLLPSCVCQTARIRHDPSRNCAACRCLDSRVLPAGSSDENLLFPGFSANNCADLFGLL